MPVPGVDLPVGVAVFFMAVFFIDGGRAVVFG